MRKPPIIPCFACGGHGTIPLPAELFATLKAVEATGDASAGEVFKHLGGQRATGVGVTAINNRLRQLRELGLLQEPRRFGRQLRWKVAGR